MTTHNVAAGSIDVPEEWAMQAPNIFTKAIENKLECRLALNAKAAPSQMVLMVNGRLETSGTDATAARDAVMNQLAQRAASMRKLDCGSFKFRDGVGAFVTVEYEVAPGLRSVQTHVFRTDAHRAGTIVTHLTATSTGRDGSALKRAAWPVLRSYRVATA